MKDEKSPSLGLSVLCSVRAEKGKNNTYPISGDRPAFTNSEKSWAWVMVTLGAIWFIRGRDRASDRNENKSLERWLLLGCMVLLCFASSDGYERLKQVNMGHF